MSDRPPIVLRSRARSRSPRAHAADKTLPRRVPPQLEEGLRTFDEGECCGYEKAPAPESVSPPGNPGPPPVGGPDGSVIKCVKQCIEHGIPVPEGPRHYPQHAAGLAAAIGRRCFFFVISYSTKLLHAKDGGEEGRRAQGGSCRLQRWQDWDAHHSSVHGAVAVCSNSAGPVSADGVSMTSEGSALSALVKRWA